MANHEQRQEELLQPQKTKLEGFGRVTARCYDINPDAVDIMIGQNYLTGNQIAPYPGDERPIAASAAAMAGAGETALIPVQDPDLTRWYQEVVCPDSTLIEVDLPDGPDGKLGYPYGDIVQQFCAQNPGALDTTILVTTFPNSMTTEVAAQSGIHTIQDYDGIQANCKAALRNNAREYGYKMAPGIVVYSEDELEAAIAMMRTYGKAAWVKADGSGGETAIKQQNLTMKSFEKALAFLRKQAEMYFSQSEIPPEVRNRMWAEGAWRPTNGLVLETDAGNLGEVVGICSNLVLNHGDGRTEVVNDYAQITKNGIFMGSRPFFHSDEYRRLLQRGYTEAYIRSVLRRDATNIARYNYEGNNFRGPHGQDMILFINKQQELDLFNLEINGRLPMSGIAEIAAENMGAETFLHTKLTARQKLNTLQDYRDVLNVDGIDLMHGDPDHVMAIPTIPSARWRREGNSTKLVTPAKSAKILFLGKDPEYLDYVQTKLQEQGVQFG